MTTTKKKAAPSKVTAVNLIPEMRKLSNSEKVLKIKEWLEAVDVKLLTQRSTAAMLQLAEAGYGYQPIAFVYDSYDRGELSGNKLFVDIDLPSEERLNKKEIKTSIRMPRSLYDDILAVCEKMANRPSDVIRMSLADMYLDSGLKMKDRNDIDLYCDLAFGTTLKPKERKNSTLRIREERKTLVRQLERSKEHMSEDQIEREEAVISSMKA